MDELHRAHALAWCDERVATTKILLVLKANTTALA